MYMVLFSMIPGIQTHAHQAQKQTVYPIDHKVTVTLSEWSVG